MEIVSPVLSYVDPAEELTIAKNQPPYRPLIAVRSLDGRVTSCWKLSFRERLILLFEGKIWTQQLTFNRPYQPLKVMFEEPSHDECFEPRLAAEQV